MKFFDLFKRKAPIDSDQTSVEELLDRFIASQDRNDYLGNAALASDKARSAVSTGDFNSAWGFYQEAKDNYLQHAIRENFTPAQTLAIDSSVSQPLANILRLEGKHRDALVHIVYWIACDPRPSKMQQQKLRAYFNRCKFTDAVLADVEALASISRVSPDFISIRSTIGGWSSQD